MCRYKNFEDALDEMFANNAASVTTEHLDQRLLLYSDDGREYHRIDDVPWDGFALVPTEDGCTCNWLRGGFVPPTPTTPYSAYPGDDPDKIRRMNEWLREYDKRAVQRYEELEREYARSHCPVHGAK